jgi:hypothetical protein
MNGISLSLGEVTFTNMEVPEKINFGGKQRVAVQALIGGGRVISVLGIDDGEISFSGIFSGSDAANRAQILDVARALGATLPLVWDRFFYAVVISEFTAEYRKPTLIPFTIHCEVVTDPVAALAALAAPLVSLVGNDLTAAAALSDQAGVSIAGLSAASLTGFSVVQAGIAAGLASGGIALNSGVLAVNGASDPVSGAGGIGQLMSASSQMAALSNMSGYINRAAVNAAGALI